MSISSIGPFTTLTGLQPVQLPVVNSARLAASNTIPAPANDVTLANAQNTSVLLSALDQTLAQFGLSSSALGADSSVAEAEDVTADAATQNTAQATQAFLGSLYQAAAQSQVASVAAGTAESASIAAASNAAATATAAQATFVTAFNLSTFLQQLESGASDVADASTGSTQIVGTGTLAALQADFDNLLNSASILNSQVAAAANSASPTLQNFVQTFAQNIPDLVSPISPISPFGNLIETTA